MSKRKSTEEFILDAIAIHGNRYIYDKVKYNNALTKVTITCPIHGDFDQRPNDHITGKNGCNKCAINVIRSKLSSSTSCFIDKAIKVHGNKYDYSSTEYTGAKTKVKIICPKHGSFWQTPNDHLNGCGCRHCRTESTGWTDSKWKEQAARSNQFQDFKFYIVKIFNEEESFIKVGKTFVSFNKRFSDISQYYHYKILHTVTADADTVCKLERRIIHNNKGYRYVPKTQFNGHTECFTQITYEGNVYAN